MSERLLNYVNGTWREAKAERYLDVNNPATTEVLPTVPLTPPSEVDEAAQLALAAFPAWSRATSSSRRSSATSRWTA